MAMKKKSHPKFNVPNFGAKNRKRVKERWRKQRGADNKKRIKKAFAGAEPNIGYGNPEETRGVRANGKKVLLIQNINELKQMLADPDIADYDVSLASSLSRKKRLEIIALANQNKIRVTNSGVK